MTELTWAEAAAAVAALDPAAVDALDRDDISAARWYGGKGRPIERMEAVEAFDLSAGVLAVVDIGERGGEVERLDCFDPLDRAALAAIPACGGDVIAIERIDRGHDLVPGEVGHARAAVTRPC